MNADSNKEITTITWFKEFIGVGYDFYDVHVNIIPLFKDKTYAVGLWKKTFERIDANQIKIKFVEHEDNYWFIVYTTKSEDNIGFVKNIAISENYYKFKAAFENKAILRFGIYKEYDEHKKDNESKKYHLELLKKSKFVHNVKVAEYSELPAHSLERGFIDDNILQNPFNDN
ncbi:MAG TPA: hypothetical protein VJ695_10610 [Nitrososphaera sp.]|nr:hypothetical protein [Nitrososphaera sp.]